MQKEIYFNFNGHDFDFDFVHPTLNNMYVVYDKVSGLNMSGIIVCKNDFIAIQGFKKFIDEQKQSKEHDYSIYQLFRLGTVNYESKKVFPNNEEEFTGFVCDSNMEFDTFFNQSVVFIQANMED